MSISSSLAHVLEALAYRISPHSREAALSTPASVVAPPAMPISDGTIPSTAPTSFLPSQRPRMYHVKIITSESRFDALMTALEHIGITGMTVTRVLGYGLQKGHKAMYEGSGAAIDSKLLPKIQCDLVVSKIPPETIVETAKKVLHTGRYGDGKIFVNSVDNVVKIRTGEEGYDALQDIPLD